MCRANQERVVEKAPSVPPSSIEETPAWNPWTQEQVVVAKREEARLLAGTQDTTVRAGLWAAIAVAAILLALFAVRLVRRRRAREALEPEPRPEPRLEPRLEPRPAPRLEPRPEPRPEVVAPAVIHPPRWRERGLRGP